MKKPDKEQTKKIVEAIRQKSAEMPNGTQLERFELAINQLGMRDLFAPKLNTCTASKYCRLAEGRDVRPVKRGATLVPLVDSLPSQRIRQGESIIASALKELEQERDIKMNEIKNLDDLINKYKTFKR